MANEEKIKILEEKPLILKGISLLVLVISILLFILFLNSSTLFRFGSTALLVLSVIFFVLSLLTRITKYQVGDRNFYILKGIFKHALLSTHHILDETTTFWFGTHSMYYELNNLEVEAKIGIFQKSKLFANGEEIKKTK